MAAARVVNDDVEITGRGQRTLERIVNRARVAQIQADVVNSQDGFESNQVARRSPNFIAAREKRVRNSKADARARPS